MKPGVPAASVSRSISVRQRLALRVHLEDLAAADPVGPVDDDLPVEAPGAQQRRVEDVGPVRGRDEDDVVLQLEAVHLDEQLVQRLLALVVATAQTGAAVATDGVDLVHEDDARRRLLRLLEQVAHTAGADADEHLDEVRAGDGEERHARLAGDRAREQRLARAGRPVEQHALGDARAERLELLRVLEELLDLLELLDGLVTAGDVLERHLRRVGRHPLGAALPEAHHLRAAALHLVHDEEPEEDQQREWQERAEDPPPRRGADALRVERDVVSLQEVLELDLRLRRRVVDLDPGIVLVDQRRGDLLLLRVELHELDRLRFILHTLDEIRVRDLLRALLLRNQRLARQIDEQHDDDQWKESAAKEASHRRSPGRIRVALPLCSARREQRLSYAPSGKRSSLNTPTYGRFLYRSAKSSP